MALRAVVAFVRLVFSAPAVSRSARERLCAYAHNARVTAGETGRYPIVMDALNGCAPSWLQLARQAIKILDRAEREARVAEERSARFTRKRDRRPMEAVAKGKATAKKRRPAHFAKRSSARRLAQRAELGARRFPRELSATAIVLKAMAPGHWYFRSQIRAACPELPAGSLSALLGGGGYSLLPGSSGKGSQPGLGRIPRRFAAEGRGHEPRAPQPVAIPIDRDGGSGAYGNPDRPDAVDSDSPLAGRIRKRAGSASTPRARGVATALRP